MLSYFKMVIVFTVGSGFGGKHRKEKRKESIPFLSGIDGVNPGNQ